MELVVSGLLSLPVAWVWRKSPSMSLHILVVGFFTSLQHATETIYGSWSILQTSDCFKQWTLYIDRVSAALLGLRVFILVKWDTEWIVWSIIGLSLVLACDVGAFTMYSTYRLAHFMWHWIAFMQVGIAFYLKRAN
jgi:hypothetical protein